MVEKPAVIVLTGRARQVEVIVHGKVPHRGKVRLKGTKAIVRDRRKAVTARGMVRANAHHRKRDEKALRLNDARSLVWLRIAATVHRSLQLSLPRQVQEPAMRGHQSVGHNQRAQQQMDSAVNVADAADVGVVVVVGAVVKKAPRLAMLEAKATRTILQMRAPTRIRLRIGAISRHRNHVLSNPGMSHSEVLTCRPPVKAANASLLNGLHLQHLQHLRRYQHRQHQPNPLSPHRQKAVSEARR